MMKVFSRDKYISSAGLETYLTYDKHWVDKLHGKVVIDNKIYLQGEVQRVSDKWCIDEDDFKKSDRYRDTMDLFINNIKDLYTLKVAIDLLERVKNNEFK